MSSGYTKDLIDLIEAVYGVGFLSQGGRSGVDSMLDGIILNGKKVLDVGSGLGGIEIYLAEKHDLEIIGIDVDPNLVKEAKERLDKAQKDLAKRVSFVLEGPSDYLKQFADNTFDIVMSRETILHIPVKDKVKYFGQVYRVLKPGGKIVIMDWMHNSPDYSKELKDMIDLDGIPYNLISKQEYLVVLKEAGFKNISFVDTTHETARLSAEDCKKILESKDDLIKRFGEDLYEDSLASWTIQKNVFERGELMTGVFKAEK